MASNSKKRRRVLGASCILAALIIASSSFAWFTSKDEVTNRLSASANYGVSIAEDYTPPKNWVPGQKIDKNVAVVNTGNVDAFVRTWLEGEMNLLAQVRDKTTWDDTSGKFVDTTNTKNVMLNSNTVFTKGDGSTTKDSVTDGTDEILKLTTDKNLIDLGMTYSYEDNATNGEKVYLKELDTTVYHNPNTPTTATTNPVEGTEKGFNEVMSVQAGGTLAYLKTGAANGQRLFIYTPDNANTFKSNKGNEYNVLGEKTYTVTLETSGTNLTDGEDIKVAGQTIYVKDEDTAIKYLGEHIDSDNFYPAATGLFVFRRNADKDKETNDPTVSDYEFSGYYYVKTATNTETGLTTTNDTAAKVFNVQGKYFALQNDKVNTDQRSNYVLEKDKYSIVRADDGSIKFYPYAAPADYVWDDDGDNSTADVTETVYKVDGKYYTANGIEKKASDATTVTDGTTTKYVTLFTAQQKVYENDGLTWKYFDSDDKYKEYTKSGSPTYYVYDSKIYDSLADLKKGKESTTAPANLTNTAASGYSAGSDTSITTGAPFISVSKDDVLINIDLANTIGDGSENWTKMEDETGATNKYTFYYNNDVEEGATTSQLVDAMTLDEGITQDDYIAFDFDLNVFMESKQVTISDTGAETTTSVTPWSATSGRANVGTTTATATLESDNVEIKSIAWS